MYEEYLAILARVLTAQTVEDEGVNNAYQLVDELYKTLEDVYFPSMPQLSERLQHTLDSVKGMSICPEVVGKEVWALYNHYTNSVFPDIAFELACTDYQWISDIRSQIPMIILHSDEITIQAVNNFYGKSFLNRDEYEGLMKQSNRNKVALNRMVKFFIVGLPLKNKNKCYVVDNTYREISGIFAAVICNYIYKVNAQDIPYLSDRNFRNMKYVLTSQECYQQLLEKGSLEDNKVQCIKELKDTEPALNHKCANLSFLDEFRFAISPLLAFYNRQIADLEDKAGAIRNDLIRKNNWRLNEFEDEIVKELTEYKEARSKIADVLVRIENELIDIDVVLNERINKENACFTCRHKDMLFEYYFAIVGTDKSAEEEFIRHVFELQYEHKNLLMTYAKSVHGTSKKYTDEEKLKEEEWECAKMLLHFRKQPEVDEEIDRLIRMIGPSRFTTGEEWYYWSRIIKSENAIRKAIQMGCKIAMDKYYEDNQDDEYALKILSDHLYPQACIKLGDAMVLTEDKPITRFNDPRLFYYKVAAAVGSEDGMQKIVDIIYQNTVWQYFKNSGVPIKNRDAEIDIILTGEKLIDICSYLITKNKKETSNKEICAVIAFCLNQNWSEIHKTVYYSGTDAAHMCKGYMYEYGKYSNKDLEKALAQYDKVHTDEIPAVKNSRARLKRKLERMEKEREDEYDADKDYSATSTREYYGREGFLSRLFWWL